MIFLYILISYVFVVLFDLWTIRFWDSDTYKWCDNYGDVIIAYNYWILVPVANHLLFCFIVIACLGKIITWLFSRIRIFHD